ncbi:class I SAM-dependent methyltransferase [Chondrinema litorale]|uniref:class I SAM-dependent methyltransferase n=1 Tax=Chondrinema litorale TaxID=2994555 RepID=UPI0025440F1A|nr:class I SAM-dependent methyltransferase [Chondrinema litorale]UZR94369.1 methyltransferase domain-containing protein [Chondrinema litorale]
MHQQLLKEIDHSYKRANFLYSLFWDKNSSSSIHFGYWDKSIKNHSQALQLHKEKLSEMANISKQAKVLDMGCGVGGGAFFLAQKFNAQVTGLNICSTQLKEARQKAKRLNVDSQVNFLELDYLHSQLENDTFDVIWATESFFHCDDKTKFIQECYRLLKPRGVLLIADYFISRQPDNAKETSLMNNWFDGFHIPYLLSRDQFESEIAIAGFDEFHYKDVSENVVPSSNRLFLLGYIGVIAAFPLRIFPKNIRKQLPFQERHALSTKCQHKALKKGLWEYGFVSAIK